MDYRRAGIVCEYFIVLSTRLRFTGQRFTQIRIMRQYGEESPHDSDFGMGLELSYFSQNEAKYVLQAIKVSISGYEKRLSSKLPFLGPCPKMAKNRTFFHLMTLYLLSQLFTDDASRVKSLGNVIYERFSID